MPSSTEPVPLDPNTFRFVLLALKHCDELKIDWAQVAAEWGIGYGRNASSKFRDLVKRHGFKFEGRKLVDVNGGARTATGIANHDANVKGSPATPKRKMVAGAKAVVGGTPKKRKMKMGAQRGEVEEESELEEPKVTKAKAVLEAGQMVRERVKAAWAEKVEETA